ncbi:MAG: hypothetical protein ACI8WB_005239, partial [Phenylobacterium sp.]
MRKNNMITNLDTLSLWMESFVAELRLGCLIKKHLIPVFLMCIGIFTVSPVLATETLPNHYIVLFDASGSMRTDYKNTFWDGATRDNEFMAKRLSVLINKALNDQGSKNGIPAMRKQDMVSFALFSLEWYKPSYANDRMFLTNKTLELQTGLPGWSAYLKFDNSARVGVDSSVSLVSAFGGHSPIVAATAGVLPFITKQIRQTSALPKGTKIGRIFIVRITDGTFNARANGADESSVIIRTIDYLNELSTKKTGKTPFEHPQDYEQYLTLANQVNQAFDIGSVRADCVLTAKAKSTRLDAINCEKNAYRLVKTKGDGFLISYMEVKPRGGSVHSLASVESKTVELQREARDGKIVFVENNRVVATGDGNTLSHTKLNKVSLKKGEGGDYIECLRAENVINCQDEDEILLNREEADKLPINVRYQFEYNRSFKGEPLLYPFTYALEPYTISVALKEKAPSEDDNRFYLLPRDPEGFSLGFLNPLRIIPTEVKVPDYEPISDKLLLSEAGAVKTLKTAALTRRSNGIKDKYMAQEVYFNNLARLIYGLLALSGILAYVFWPRYKLKVEQESFSRDALRLDFNHRDHEPVALIAGLKVTNVAQTRFHKPFDLILSMAAPQFFILTEDGSSQPFSALTLNSRSGAPLSLAKQGEVEQNDALAVTGKEYPIFFDPTEIIDLSLVPEAGEYQVTLQAGVDITAKKGGTDAQLIKVNMLLIPEKSNLHIERPVTIELDDKAHPVLSVNYRNGVNDAALGHYRLHNNTRYDFSLPATGEMEVEVQDINSNRKDKVVQFQWDPAEPSAARIAFDIKHQDVLELILLMDFTSMSNPIEYDDYQVIVRFRESSASEWRIHDQWTLRLQRDSARTEVSMQIVESENKYSLLLNEGRLSSEPPYVVGSAVKPVKLRMESGAGRMKTKLFTLALVNACHDGFGFARWTAQIEVMKAQGIKIEKSHNGLHFVDPKGKKATNGTLYDSSSDEERTIHLPCELHHSEINLLRRNIILTLKVTVQWSIFENGEKGTNPKRDLGNEITVECHLQHEPPRRAIAIDSGTSGYAIAHSRGPGSAKLLQLQRQAQKLRPDMFYIDNMDPDSPFLSSECNVILKPEELIKLRPDDAQFITLPRHPRAIAQQPEKVFVGVKALSAAGYETLPMSAAECPYKAEGDGIERHREPPLDDVIAGIYRGLLSNYIEPILTGEQSGFSHVYLTHPNTYTPNHVAHLRKIVEGVFQGYRRGKDDIVYADNIRFFSESDAVAFYYMLNVRQSYGGDWSRVPNREHILVYDIGAGTLDLTYLQVDWSVTPKKSKTPKRVKVLRRGGVSKAGNLLDECIARDLHDFLEMTLDQKDYSNPIVVKDSDPMSREERFEMDLLRQRIQKAKIDLSKGETAFRILLSFKQYRGCSIVRTNIDETPEIYQQYDDLEGTIEGEVYWTPSRETLLSGKYVQAFLQQVTQVELDRFFGSELPKLNTVILSGRTLLWPGLEEGLRKTLGDISHWENFKGDAKELKKAVVMGVLESEFRWPDLEFIPPEVIGRFGIRYEYAGPGDWQFFEFEQSGDCQQHAFHDAALLEIGLQSNNGFTACLSLIPYDLYDTSDKLLDITLTFDAAGTLQASIKNTQGETQDFNEIVNISVLSYSAQPWPIGSSKLV